MAALRVAARRLPGHSRLSPSFPSSLVSVSQRRFAATANVAQDVKQQVQVGEHHLVPKDLALVIKPKQLTIVYESSTEGVYLAQP